MDYVKKTLLVPNAGLFEYILVHAYKLSYLNFENWSTSGPKNGVFGK
jgi:hypothetical protein